MVISSPDIPLQEEIRYFLSKAEGGNMRKLFADRVVHILLHTLRKQLRESEKNKAGLLEWLVLLSRWSSQSFLSHSSHSTLENNQEDEKMKNRNNKMGRNSAELLICLYLNPDKHLDQAAVSSAGKCTGKKKKIWNCIWDTPALSRSAGLWKSSLFSLAVLRKSHRALRKLHNKGSKNRRPDLLFWPCCVFTPLGLQHSELRDCFHQRNTGLLWRLALPWEESRWDTAATWSAPHPLIIMSRPTICTQGWWSLYV